MYWFCILLEKRKSFVRVELAHFNSLQEIVQINAESDVLLGLAEIEEAAKSPDMVVYR